MVPWEGWGVIARSYEGTTPPVVAVVGGGISGLAAAHFLARRGGARIVVLEAGPRLGGKVRTDNIGGLRIEAGPDGFLADPGLLALCEELGLGPDLVEAMTTQAYFWAADGALRPLAPPDMRHTAVSGSAPTRFFALRGGLDALIAALEGGTPGIDVRRNAPVHTLRPATSAVDVVLDGSITDGTAKRAIGQVLHADAVILAVPAPQAARLLHGLRPEAAAALADIPYLDIGVVALLYPGRPWPLDGSGFLATEHPGRVLSGCTWLSAKWPHLAGTDGTAVRATVGGSGSTAWSALDDEALVAAVHRDLVAAMGPAPTPIASRVTRWRQGITDHRFRDPAHLEQARAALSGSAVTITAGAYLGGGMASCVADAARAADAVAARLHVARA